MVRGRSGVALGTSDRIRAAAVEFFRVRGYSGTSTREIASRAGITAGSLYNHYDSKEALLFLVLVSVHADALTRLRAALQGQPHPAAALRGAVSSHVLFHTEQAAAVAVTYQDMEFLSSAHRATVVALRREYERVLLEIVHDGIARRVFSVDDPRLAVIAILSVGVRVSAWFKPGGRLSAEQVAEQCADYALRLVGVCSGVGDGRTRDAGPGTGIRHAERKPARRAAGRRTALTGAQSMPKGGSSEDRHLVRRGGAGPSHGRPGARG